MRFVCDSCHAQYMISDEKVGAKGVKVRCKKCSHVILVRRTEAGPAPVHEAPPPPPPDPEDGLETQVMQNPLIPNGNGAHDPDLTNPGFGGPPPSPAPTAAGKSVLGGLDEDEIGAVFDQVLNTGVQTSPGADRTEPGPTASTPLGDEDDDERMSTRVLDAETVKKLALEASGGGGASAPESKNGEAAHDWFVAIDEKQTGPLTVEKVREYWNRGEIGPDSLCWRAGFSDWTPLSEVAELASVLAPRPAKPVIVAPAPAKPAVVSVPVESAFSAGGVTTTVRSEVQVPLAAAPVETTSGGWKPSAASALASLVKEEIEALAKPTPKVEPPVVDERPPGTKSLLDVPIPDARPTPAKQNGVHAAIPSAEPGARPLGAGPAQPTGTFTAPGFTTYRPPPRKGLMMGLALGGGVVVLALVGVIVFLATREAPAPAMPPPSVAAAPAAPAPSAPPPARTTNLPMPPPPSLAPVAAAPSPARAEAPAPPERSAPESKPERSRDPEPVRRERTRDPEPERTASRPSRREEPEAPAKKPELPSGGDDEFEKVFGGGDSDKPAPKSESTAKKGRGVYIPPAPGGGADIPETLGQSDILQVVLAHKPALARCAEEQKKKEPGVSGKLVMRWQIHTSGKTSNVSVVSEEFRASHMATCVGALIKSWKFPRHKVQGEPVTFPFKF